MKRMTDTTSYAPSREEIASIAEQAREALPDAYLTAAMAVALRVEDFASDEQLADVGLDDPFELTGLYDGIPLT